jgi:hypothetical protein
MKKVTKVPFFLFLLFLGTRVFAQDPSNPGSDPGEAAPISDYVIPMLLIVLIFGFRVLIVKKEKVQNN